MIEELKTTKRILIHNDSPADGAHHFGFSIYADTFAKIIADRSNETPLTIAINGAWGSGKTTLMRTIRDTLSQIHHDVDRNGGDEIFRRARTVWFNAWKYSSRDAILVALVEEIAAQMTAEGFPRQRLEQMKTPDGGLDWSRISRTAEDLLSQSGGAPELKGVLKSDSTLLRNLPLLKEFELFLDRLIAWSITGTPPDAQTRFDDSAGVLVFFIDDLDRCQPNRVARVLETMKLFMDRPGCVFVIGMDSEIVEKAVKAQYKTIEGFDEHAYMDKIVQLQFNLPPIRPEHIRNFIQEDLIDGQGLQNPILRYLEEVSETVEANPRTVKRFLNTFAIQQSLAESRGFLSEGVMDEDLLAKWIIISFAFETFAERALQRPLLIAELQEAIRQRDGVTAESDAAIDGYSVAPHLREFIEDPRLVNLLKQGKLFPSDEEEISVYTHLSASTQPRRAATEQEEAEAEGTDEMVLVDPGKFLMGDVSRASYLDAFEIDVFPVTNRQFKRFVEGTGHKLLPANWADGTYPEGKADHPVVNVNWEDATAYAAWSKKRLPTEQEWEKSARGPNGRLYPWGNSFNRYNCNSRELGLNGTTEVGQHPNGASQYGIFDLSGNVWEWTDTDVFPDNEDAKVIRGGCFANPRESVRTTTRAYERAERRRRDIGFRCARDAMTGSAEGGKGRAS